MTVVPTPLLPRGLVARPTVQSGWIVVDPDHRQVGTAGPYVVADPGGDWFGKRVGQPAARYKPTAEYSAEALALAHVCRCWPADIQLHKEGTDA